MSIWKDQTQPFIILAPMAGYTESPFRRLIKEIEPSTILVSELVSAEALRRGNEKTMRMIDFVPEEKGYYGVQLFGSEENAFIEAAKVVEEIGADYIDLNLGCPSPKVINSGHGSALLKDIDQTAKMIRKLVQSTKLPVTVKMRLGFYNDADLITNSQKLADSGISALAIHGRTTKQKFTGSANWDQIYTVKDQIDIPVIGNGDITSAAIAKNRLKNLDGIMIGRASLRNPWVFRQTREIFEGKEVSKKPELKDQLAFFRRHAELATEFKNEKWAMIELRKHFAHFLRGFHGASHFRGQLIRVNTIAEMNTIFKEIIETTCQEN